MGRGTSRRLVEGPPSQTADFVRRPSTMLRTVPLPTKTGGGLFYFRYIRIASARNCAALLERL